MSTPQAEMERLATGLTTKSEKIRTLGKAGYPRQQIADFLSIRYQHVRNVLVDAERTGGSVRARQVKPASRVAAATQQSESALTVRIGAGGQFALSEEALRSAGLREGDTVFVHASEGEIQLLSPRTAMQQAQAMVRKLIPAGVSLVDELIEQRRREVGRG
jgi:hypothetical protein